MHIPISPPSYSSARIELLCNKNSIGVASGFFYENKENTYLVSNWHVFSGRSCHTGQPLYSSAIPDEMRIHFNAQRGNHFVENISQYSIGGSEFSLVDKDGNNKWMQHPAGQDVDVACIKIKIQKGYCVRFANAKPNNTIDINLDLMSPSDEVVIVGFPNDIRQDPLFPIWKFGHVASEPQFKYAKQDCFLVDSATRKGMSGSPVYYLPRNVFLPGPRFSIFCGVYSGRYAGDELTDMQLGRIWHINNIEEILSHGVIGCHQLR